MKNEGIYIYIYLYVTCLRMIVNLKLRITVAFIATQKHTWWIKNSGVAKQRTRPRQGCGKRADNVDKQDRQTSTSPGPAKQDTQTWTRLRGQQNVNRFWNKRRTQAAKNSRRAPRGSRTRRWHKVGRRTRRGHDEDTRRTRRGHQEDQRRTKLPQGRCNKVIEW